MTGLLVGVYAGIVLLANQVVSIKGPVAVAGFAARLQDAVDISSVQDELTRAVQQAPEPAHITVWKC